MAPAYVHMLLVLLSVVSAVGCVGRFDYNLVLALGWLYLNDMNPVLTNYIGFYIMVLGSILVDCITIVLSANKGGTFTVLLIPLIEIIIKVVIVGICGYGFFKRKQEGGQSNRIDGEESNRQEQSYRQEQEDKQRDIENH